MIPGTAFGVADRCCVRIAYGALQKATAAEGIGRLVVDSVLTADMPVVQGVVLLGSLVFIFVNLFVDVLYAVMDPRIRISSGN